MARPTWKDVNFNPVSLPSGAGARRSAFSEPLNNVDAALGRFREVIGDYDRIQREQTNAELAKRMMGYTDPNELRSAIASGSLAQGLDPKRVSAEAYSNANNQIGNLLASAAADLANRTGEQSLSEAIYKDDRLRRANEFRDNNIGSLQQGVLLGSKGDIAGQGSNVAALDFTNAPYEAMDAWTKDITGIGLPTGQLNENIRSHKADEGLRSQVNNLRQQELNLALQQRRDQQQALAQQQSLQAMVNDAARRLNKMPPSMRAQELAMYRETNPDLFRLIAPMYQEESTGVLKGGGGNIGGSATGSGGRSRGGTPTDGTIAYTESNKFNDTNNTAFVEGAVPTPMTTELELIGQELNATNSGQRDAFSGIPTNATTGEIKEALIKSGVPADEVDSSISYVVRNTKGTKLTGREIAQAAYDSFRYQDPNFFSIKNMLGLDTGLSYDSDSATRAVNKANSKANRVIDAQSKKIEAQFNNLYQTDQRVQQLRAEAKRARGDIELYGSRYDMSDPETQDVVIRHSQNALNKEQEADKLEASNAKNLAAFKESLRAAQGNPSKEKTKVPQGKIVPRDTIPARIGRSPEKTKAEKEENERFRIMSRLPSNVNPDSLTIDDVISLYPDEFPANNSAIANQAKAANMLKVLQGR